MVGDSGCYDVLDSGHIGSSFKLDWMNFTSRRSVLSCPGSSVGLRVQPSEGWGHRFEPCSGHYD